MKQPAKDSPNEAAVRTALIRHVAAAGSTQAISEFWIPPTNERADLVVLDRAMRAFEIKTARDSLNRLARQVEAYSRLFDECSLVVDDAHIERAMETVPCWWGVLRIQAESRIIRFETVRRAGTNPGLDPAVLVRLLWSEEARSALALHGEVMVRERHELWRELLRRLDLDALRRTVRNAIARRDPKSARIPTRRFASASLVVQSDAA